MKIAVVLNTKHDLPSQLNALGHSSLGLARLLAGRDLAMRDFHDAHDKLVARMTDHPLIVFSARNGAHIRDLHEEAQFLGIPANAFFAVMKSANPREQAVAVRAGPASGQDYIALAFAGNDADLRPLTRRFSLYKGQST